VRAFHLHVLTATVAASLACGQSRRQSTTTSAPAERASNDRALGQSPKSGLPFARPALLMSQAQFTWSTDKNGERKPQPGPAQLVILTLRQGRFDSLILEDPDSRVFHKAICFDSPVGSAGATEPTILTLGATGAHLKTWRWRDNHFEGTSHWDPHFGGKWDRLRDAELVDIDSDGKKELIIGTHDQGVIALVRPTADTWAVQEIFRRPNTFVHEIEVGDVDGDGKPEIYATLSQPNKAAYSQAGEILGITKRGKGFVVESVDSFNHRHAKEILVTDLDGDGHDELYASIEAESETVGDKIVVHQPLEIRRYTKVGRTWKTEILTALDDAIQARFILVGDLRAAGKKELVVTTMRDGIWLLTPPEKPHGLWRRISIDKDSSGFEHAATLADLDGDGRPELYVAADDQARVRRYTWDGATFSREDIFTLEPSDLTWSIQPCQ
jgi:hypothetical protein